MGLTFNQYCEEFLDLQTGLMSDQQIKDAKIGFDLLSSKKPAPTNPDLKLKVSELRGRCERLTRGQKNAIEKVIAANLKDEQSKEALIAATISVKMGDQLLSGHGTKKQFVEHFEINSHASRLMNQVRQNIK